MATKLPLAFLLFASAACAEAVRFEVDIHEDVLSGKSWGLADAYEKLIGTMHFEVDAKNPANERIRFSSRPS